MLVDSVVAVNEVIDKANRSDKECLVSKVDFDKMHDAVSWSFLDYMFIKFYFNGNWSSWIWACFFPGNLAVQINGSPTLEIYIQIGLKQIDPQYPFLFLRVDEGLSSLI